MVDAGTNNLEESEKCASIRSALVRLNGRLPNLIHS